MSNFILSRRSKVAVWMLALSLSGSAMAQGNKDLNVSYQRPAESIAKLIEAPATPTVSFDAKGEWMLVMERPGYPSIEEIAAPELRIGGLRINPAVNGASRGSSSNNLKLKKINGGQEFAIQGLPANAKITDVTWSPDEQHVSFLNTASNGVALWVMNVASRTARKLTNALVNDAYGNAVTWTPDSKNLLVKMVNPNRGEAPKTNTTPAGPIVQENLGKTAASRTYQDLLKNRSDEAQFDYYLTSQLTQISLDGQQTKVGEQGIIRSFSTSPDGQYLLVATTKRPYSYLVPANSFPYVVQVWDRQGKVVKQIADIPSGENIPVGFNAVAAGPRSVSWRPDQPATLFWIEAQDGGDDKKDVPVRDIVYMQPAPFSAQPIALAGTKLRYAGIAWGNNDLALVTERWWKTRQERTIKVKPSQPNAAPVVLIERSYEDLYSDPGTPMMEKNQFGRYVLLTDKSGQNLYMISEGGSPEGNRPFLSKFNLTTKKNDILWRSSAPYYERPVSVLSADKGTFITRRESENDPPNYFLRQVGSKKLTAVTKFPHPTPELIGVDKQLLTYKRNDGVTLTATLYTPKGYKKEQGRLPMLLWAYPREFKDAATAGQVKSSPYEFTRISSGSPLFWVTRGYAVLDRTDIPIVGEGDAEPNDTYVEQLVASAKAAIDEVAKMGIADPNRVAVGGHSYGAFMTANLLAHSDLFAAGIARSGAYNRTLTPFGFQAEERTFWQAPEVYGKMSPFNYANKIKTPILLLHGEADNNSGTFPIQSERFYNALKGHGATTRYVVLPSESHGYAAKESIMHMLWEMDQWLEKYVKNKPQPQTMR
ncbi:aminoacyl peptidase [Rufibacter sp. DG15C]|uniref:prolyl oligopeptidase family serine peptidase n=1 Tax=Rufibacter sp. DG15C TaxID=1379909 RepID=UPI00078E7BDE|nr:prolyl oligopeptidase family serine peptidase [Rufibacter sp. DG15C]AMM52513.1 aminoacyl peptidase [Rufibacter sp. DG15C]